MLPTRAERFFKMICRTPNAKTLQVTHLRLSQKRVRTQVEKYNAPGPSARNILNGRSFGGIFYITICVNAGLKDEGIYICLEWKGSNQAGRLTKIQLKKARLCQSIEQTRRHSSKMRLCSLETASTNAIACFYEVPLSNEGQSISRRFYAVFLLCEDSL